MMTESDVGHVVTVGFTTGRIDGILVNVVDDEGQVFFPFDNSLHSIPLELIVNVGHIIELDPDLDGCRYKEVCPHATDLT